VEEAKQGLIEEREGKPDSSRLLQEEKDVFNFSAIVIGLASPERIKSWSYGQVKKPETINYRTFRPERDGLFCERIFGPTKDYECFCGKFKSIRYKGVVCDRCRVEVTRAEVRRERMGHVELVSPVSHIWYFKRVPSQMSLVLDISVRNLERILYFEAYVVTDPGSTPLEERQVINEEEYQEYLKKYGHRFKAGMGAEAIRDLLKSIDLKREVDNLRAELSKNVSKQKQRKLLRRLKTLTAFLESNNRPEWMILSVIPVIPPELRPMVQLDGGRFATSDLNDLYRRVINRNNRLKRLLDLKAPEIIIRNEKRMLQEAVDSLFDNGRRGKVVKGPGNRPLKSLSDMLKGKQGRFRQNLLGKRVDYSGRSVIVVGPKLKIYQCGIPKRMALELFKPFVMHALIHKGLVHNIKTAKRIIEEEREEVWRVLEEVVKGKLVLLNRAPTLHRAGIQAFEPVLVDGNAIMIHPLVCTPFNADFDGDQMAIHVPLSIEAQLEARLLMLSIYSILSSANGKPLVSPSQDMILGCCYLTRMKKGEPGEGMWFSSPDDAILAYEHGVVGLHAEVGVRIHGELVKTTVGRILFNQILPPDCKFVNEVLNKKKIGALLMEVYRKHGLYRIVELLDEIKDLGFRFATKYGGSISMVDLKDSPKREELIKKSKTDAEKIIRQYQDGIITSEERYNEIVDLWTYVADDVSRYMYEALKEDRDGFNPLFMMLDSGARGSKQQIRQLCGMRGLMAKPSGEIIELPITSNFKEGLLVLEYFISTHGARKGLADTALKTADAGYLTRRLVDITQEIVISEEDCGTMKGVAVEAIKEGDEVIESLEDRILGRVALEDVVHPMAGTVLVKANEEIDEEKVELIQDAEIERVKIRSVLTCESPRGVCRMCYGRNLALGRLVEVGEPVGVIAAQSIGEPGTQLTMRTFHIGGTAYRKAEEKEIRLKYPVEIVELPKHLIEMEANSFIATRGGSLIVRRVLASYDLPEEAEIQVFDGLWVNANDPLGKVRENGTSKTILAASAGMIRVFDNRKLYIVAKERSIPMKTGSQIFVKEGQIVQSGSVIAEFDPYNEPILAEKGGRVEFKELVIGRTIREELDENTGLFRRIVVEDRLKKFQPAILIKDKNGNVVSTSLLPHGARLVVDDGEEIKAGGVLAKFPQEMLKTKDITGGLPRVARLFEARRPKEQAVVSEIDGVVTVQDVSSGRVRKISVKSPTGEERVYSVPAGKHLKVHDGDRILAGDMLTEGSVDCQDILRIKGDRQLQEYLVNEIQEVYRLQGVEISDKHIELVIRQMLQWVKVIDPGDTSFVMGEQVNRFLFKEENDRVVREGGRPAQAKTVLLGITKASLNTDSFISAASFQETTRVLTEAAVMAKADYLRGLKENVIIGSLIPAGTGIIHKRDISISVRDKVKNQST
jgi:DNA-directed RNA polymerase subunit beta'